MYTNNDEFESIEGAAVAVNGSKITVKGAKGELTRDFGPGVQLLVEGKKINVSTKAKAMLNSVKGHVANMMKGVTEGYVRKMKILYAHFPMSIEVKGKDIIIKNFIGEKSPRKAKAIGNVKVTVKGQELTIEGADKEEVGQTAANLKTATKIKARDCRIFQDGIYPVNE